MTISRIASIPLVIAQGTNSQATAINLWNQLRLSTYYNNYAPMYDQMKIDKVRLKITGNQSGSVTANLAPAVVLAFDRNGLNDGQQVSVSAISTYSSAQLKQWSTGNAFAMYQTIYPSTIMEKGQYIPTASLESPSDNTESSNPCVNTSDSTLPFKPITLIGVDLGLAATGGAQTFAFTVEYEFTVTFRGMRKPSLSSSSVLVPLEAEIDSNDTYIYDPEDYNADGFSSVTLSVNIPSPASKFDSFSIYNSSDYLNYNLLRTITRQELTFIDPSSTINVTINTNYMLVLIDRNVTTLPDGTLGHFAIIYNPGPTSLTRQVLTSQRYALISISIPGIQAVLSLNAGDDPIAYTSFVPQQGYYAELTVDYEDLDLFLN